MRYVALDAGRLRHVVDIEVRQDTQDATSGGIDSVWVPLFENVRAAIEPLSVREAIAADKDQSKVSARIVIRHRAGLEAAQRIVHGTKCCSATVGVEYWNPEGFLRDNDTGLEYVTIPCSRSDDE
jgi:SPP1 family predicted phage head-tail adaptor